MGDAQPATSRKRDAKYKPHSTHLRDLQPSQVKPYGLVKLPGVVSIMSVSLSVEMMSNQMCSRPSWTQVQSTACLVADAQGLVNADDTWGGYWKKVVISWSTPLWTSRIACRSSGLANQWLSGPWSSPLSIWTSCAQCSMSSTWGLETSSPWSCIQMVTCMMSKLWVSEGKCSLVQFPKGKPVHLIITLYRPGNKKSRIGCSMCDEPPWWTSGGGVRREYSVQLTIELLPCLAGVVGWIVRMVGLHGTLPGTSIHILISQLLIRVDAQL